MGRMFGVGGRKKVAVPGGFKKVRSTPAAGAFVAFVIGRWKLAK